MSIINSQEDVEQCVVTPNQETASAVAGNIGIVRAKAIVWDHDPFLSRPTQQTSFSFTEQTEGQAQVDDAPVGALFEAGGVCLQPIFNYHDMWVAVLDFFNGVKKMDYVGTVFSNAGLAAHAKMPGGTIYDNGNANNWRVGKEIFPHQLWIHTGSLLSRYVVLSPSEYSLSLTDTEAAQYAFAFGGPTKPPGSVHKITRDSILNAPRWALTPVETSTGITFWPVQTQKSSAIPVHWSLNKFTPMWQGEDFFVTIRKGYKDTDDKADDVEKNPTSPQFEKDPNTGEKEVADTDWPEFKYLMYNPDNKPPGWVDGISNSAFWLLPEKPGLRPDLQSARDKYWWKYKTYILIEIGVRHSKHNYFIEIVKGRQPRFLHLGEEYDRPDRLTANPDPLTKPEPMLKCRTISDDYKGVSSEELLNKSEFRVSVRNHIGDIIVTFSGYEHAPWRIRRFDHNADMSNKVRVPMVVPIQSVAIHGGNISAAINVSPTEYTPKSSIKFNDIQADTCHATDEDLYMTFSHMGGSRKWQPNSFVRSVLTKNAGKGTFGYDCDAAWLYEIIRNRPLSIDFFNGMRLQYEEIGKGMYPVFSSAHPGGYNHGSQNDTNVNTMKRTESHKIEISNAKNVSSSFKFGLRGSGSGGTSCEVNTDGDYPYDQFVSSWNVAVTLMAGSPFLKPINFNRFDIDPTVKTGVRFKNCVTPIATNWRLVVVGGNKATDDVEPFDISPLITSISDSWNTENYTTLKHEMKLKCYIPVGQPAINDGNADIYAIGQRLLGRIDKSSFITVAYWWDNGIGKRDAIGNNIKRVRIVQDQDGTEREILAPPEDADLLIQMTGIAFGGELEKSVNKLFLEFTIKDYMSVLEKQFIFNSPFFDGVSDRVAMYELGRMAGFDDQEFLFSKLFSEQKINRAPLGYLGHIIKNRTQIEFNWNGEQQRCPVYDLPGSYVDLANPAFRFNNGETYDAAMKKIAKVAGKTFYFDRWGVLKYETNPAFTAAFSAKDDLGVARRFLSVFDFFSTPIKPFDPLEFSTIERRPPAVFNPNEHAAHLVYDVIKYSRSVEDCINQIVLLTATNEYTLSSGKSVGGLLVQGYTFFEQIWNTDAEGFLGFNKPFYQANGVFGSSEHSKNAIAHYSRMKFPPASISFQTYGVPGLKALDIITLDNNMFYITQIAHEIDPATNRWWMNISGEWLKPFTGDLGFLVPGCTVKISRIITGDKYE